MGKKSKRKIGVVYSTNPDYDYAIDEQEEQDTLEPEHQRLYVSIDRKMRKGKEVTLVEGFIGSSDDMKELGKTLKSKCGVGGSVKDGLIMVQGNKKEKIFELLLGMGFSKTKKKG